MVWVEFQRMLDSQLEEFCRVIKPSVQYTERCRDTTASVFQLLEKNSKYPISDYVIGGGLPQAKNTSTCLKVEILNVRYLYLFLLLRRTLMWQSTWSGINWRYWNFLFCFLLDVIIQQATSSFVLHIQLCKKRILDEWWKILTDLTPPDNPGDIIKRTPNSLHFTYKVFM